MELTRIMQAQLLSGRCGSFDAYLITIGNHGTLEIAKRIGQIIRQVLEYACDRGLIELVPMGNIKNGILHIWSKVVDTFFLTNF